METNNLIGLESSGFTESTAEFDENIFSDAEKINKIRSVIKIYFTKAEETNYDSSSYGLKHILEKHLGFYVSNGELIYAMHLEDFKIERGKVNCFFNVGRTGIRLLKNSEEIKETLQIPAFYNANDYLKRKKTFLKYKYIFNALIDCRFGKKEKLKRYAYIIIALELGEDTDSVKKWMNIYSSEETVIPENILEKLTKIFNLKENEIFIPKA